MKAIHYAYVLIGAMVGLGIAWVAVNLLSFLLGLTKWFFLLALTALGGYIAYRVAMKRHAESQLRL